MKWLMFGLITLTLLAAPGPSGARTWYVNEAGTGDAPTIPAAMDSAAYGDTVLVGPGTYYGWIDMTDGVTLMSELGPTETILTHHLWEVVTFWQGASGSLEGFTITGVQWDGPECGAVLCSEAGDFLIAGNVVTGNLSCGISCRDCYTGLGRILGNTVVDNGSRGIDIVFCMDHVQVYKNISVGNACGICMHESLGAVECNDCWGNTGADYHGFDPAPSNFSADPFFCDREVGDFTLNSCSPCLPGNHPLGYDCGLIGALGQGCDYPSQVEEEGGRSWGGIKALFR